MRFSVTTLGTSAAVPVPGRYCSGVFLRTETTDVLIDCGEGTQLRLKEAGFGMGKCSVVLISHLHGDHYFGLPGLLSSLSLSGRTTPLLLVCPQHLRPRIEGMLELDRYPMRYELTFQTYEATGLDHLFDVGDLAIHAFPLRHRITTNGYLLRERPRPANIRKEKIEEYGIPWPDIRAIKGGADFTLPNGKVIPNAELTTPAAPPAASPTAPTPSTSPNSPTTSAASTSSTTKPLSSTTWSKTPSKKATPPPARPPKPPTTPA